MKGALIISGNCTADAEWEDVEVHHISEDLFAYIWATSNFISYFTPN